MCRGAVGRPVRRHMGQRHTGLAADDAKTDGLPQPSNSQPAVPAECHNTLVFFDVDPRGGPRARRNARKFMSDVYPHR